MLPGINGLEGTRRLKALTPCLRVILVSAYRDRAEIYRAAAVQVGAETFVAKDELDVSMVQTWIK
jgi:DNA-binding NarL/FixJ family response regulator